jgi:hypothetical protein
MQSFVFCDGQYHPRRCDGGAGKRKGPNIIVGAEVPDANDPLGADILARKVLLQCNCTRMLKQEVTRPARREWNDPFKARP